MKRIAKPFLSILLAISLLGFISVKANAAARPNSMKGFYYCQGLAGGTTGDLDTLDITGAGSPNTYDLIENDAAIVAVISGSTVDMYFYLFDADGTDAESSPDVIRPDDYDTAGVWRLTDFNVQTLTAIAGMDAGASSLPKLIHRDSDASAGDDNMYFTTNCTDTGDGTEDCDFTLYIQIAGVSTAVITIDADGNFQIGTASLPIYIVGNVELGHATDTTIARSGAGTVTIEGQTIQTGTDDDVPESGDFGAAAALEADGSLSNITKSEFIPIGWMDITDGGSDPPESLYATDSNSREYKIATFDGATDEDMSFVWDVPDDFTGSDIKFMWKGIVTNATGPSAEAISFQLSCISIADGEQADFAAYGSAIAATESSLTESQDDIITSAWSAAVTPTGIAAGETVHCLLNRDADSADTYAQDFGLIGIKIKWQEDPGTLTY